MRRPSSPARICWWTAVTQHSSFRGVRYHGEPCWACAIGALKHTDQGSRCHFLKSKRKKGQVYAQDQRKHSSKRPSDPRMAGLLSVVRLESVAGRFYANIIDIVLNRSTLALADPALTKAAFVLCRLGVRINRHRPGTGDHPSGRSLRVVSRQGPRTVAARGQDRHFKPLFKVPKT